MAYRMICGRAAKQLIYLENLARKQHWEAPIDPHNQWLT